MEPLTKEQYALVKAIESTGQAQDMSSLHKSDSRGLIAEIELLRARVERHIELEQLVRDVANLSLLDLDPIDHKHAIINRARDLAIWPLPAAPRPDEGEK